MLNLVLKACQWILVTEKNIGIHSMGWSFGPKKSTLLRTGNFKLVTFIVFTKANMITITVSICWFEFQDKLSKDQKENFITDIPSLLAIFGQCFYVGGMLAGPQVIDIWKAKYRLMLAFITLNSKFIENQTFNLLVKLGAQNMYSSKFQI